MTDSSPMPWGNTPAILAPMEGVTRPEFRHLLASHGGVGMLCTEFFRIHETSQVEHIRKMVVKTPGIPLSVQVMGRDIPRMVRAAEIVCEVGADVIDINMGCPTRNATKGGVGAAMLRDAKLLEDVVSAMRGSTTKLLSAKIRAGFDNSDDVLKNALIVQDSGADFIAVHPRRRVDHYDGIADWRIIAHLKKHLSIPVIGNGDIWYAKDALRMMEETGCDAVMIGRPALRNPWIFRQIYELRAGFQPFEPSGEDCASYLRKLAGDLSRLSPRSLKSSAQRTAPSEYKILGNLKENLGYLTRALDDGGTFRKAVLRSQSLSAMFELIDKQLAPLPSQELDLRADGHLALETSGSAAI